jgi:chromosome segregation ATPase
MSRRDEQLKELRAKEEDSRSGLAQARGRLARADESNRKLAETLSELAQAELATAPDLGHLEGVEEARVDLELALSELPAEGEQGVPVGDDLAQRLADTGHKAAAALAERRRRIADSLTKAKADADRLAAETAKLSSELQQNRTATIERDSSLKRTQAELATLRAELREQAASLAAKVQDLSDARTRLSAAQADLDSASQKSQLQEQALATTQAELVRAKAELAKLADAHARAATAEQAQAQLAQAFAEFGHWDDREVASIVAAQGSPLARATSRLGAIDAKDGKQAAAAQAQFLASVREQLAELATEVAAKRAEAAAQQADIAQLQEDLSSAKASLVGREQETAAARAEAEAAARRAAQAEAAARELASAITLAAGDDAGPLAKAVADAGKPLGAEAAKAGVAAMHAVSDRARKDREERQRLAADLAQAAQQRDLAQRELEAAGRRVASAEREAAEARAAERQVAAAAADLSRELLGATKAMAADTDAATAKQAGEALAGFEGLSASERVDAATGIMPALREIFTTLAIDAAETKAAAVNDRELHDKALAALRRDLDQAIAAAAPLHEELARTKEEKATLLGEITAARAKADRLDAAVKTAEEQLLQANAELDDYRARAGESSSGAAGEAAMLAKQLATHRDAHQQAEADLAALREKLAANEARLARLREEMNQRLAERDQLIADKTREYDELASQQSDALALQAKIETLAKDLAQAHDQLARYKSAHGDLTGANAQAGDLKKSLKGTEAEREALRTKLRELESELADKRGELEEAQTALEAKTREMQILRDRKDKEVEAERSSVAILREAERKLKEENVGLKARVRRLTEHS